MSKKTFDQAMATAFQGCEGELFGAILGKIYFDRDVSREDIAIIVQGFLDSLDLIKADAQIVRELSAAGQKIQSVRDIATGSDDLAKRRPR